MAKEKTMAKEKNNDKRKKQWQKKKTVAKEKNNGKGKNSFTMAKEILPLLKSERTSYNTCFLLPLRFYNGNTRVRLADFCRISSLL